VAQRERSELEHEMAGLIRLAGLPAPVEELEFAKTIGRKWRFDFAWPEQMVALEVEGATFAHGRHSRGAGMEADCEKYNTAVLLGWRVIRVTDKMIRRDTRAIDTITTVLLQGGVR
jgi:very-short-patch-repair endonuclease